MSTTEASQKFPASMSDSGSQVTAENRSVEVDGDSFKPTHAAPRRQSSPPDRAPVVLQKRRFKALAKPCS